MYLDLQKEDVSDNETDEGFDESGETEDSKTNDDDDDDEVYNLIFSNWITVNFRQEFNLTAFVTSCFNFCFDSDFKNTRFIFIIILNELQKTVYIIKPIENRT